MLLYVSHNVASFEALQKKYFFLFTLSSPVSLDLHLLDGVHDVAVAAVVVVLLLRGRGHLVVDLARRLAGHLLHGVLKLKIERNLLTLS